MTIIRAEFSLRRCKACEDTGGEITKSDDDQCGAGAPIQPVIPSSQKCWIDSLKTTILVSSNGSGELKGERIAGKKGKKKEGSELPPQVPVEVSPPFHIGDTYEKAQLPGEPDIPRGIQIPARSPSYTHIYTNSPTLTE